MYTYLSLDLAEIYNNPKLGYTITIAKILKRRRHIIDVELSDGTIVSARPLATTQIPKKYHNQIYTKEQRLEIYQKALRRACADPEVNYGLCRLFANEGAIVRHLPEFKLQEPAKRWSKGMAYWYPLTYKGWEKRIQILLNCIEMVKTAKY